MYKRPALLIEACNRVWDAKANGWHAWVGDASVWLSSDNRPVAIPQGHLRNRMLIVGTTEFDTTEFVGRELFNTISRGQTMPKEEQESILLYLAPRLRILREKRNGHEIWQVVLVQSRKGKEIIMD